MSTSTIRIGLGSIRNIQLWWNEYLKSNVQRFQHYQQTLSSKHWIQNKKATTYTDENSGPGFGQSLSSNTDMEKQLKRPSHISFNFRKVSRYQRVTRSRKSKKEWQYNGQKKRTKEQTMIYKTLHRKLKIEQ